MRGEGKKRQRNKRGRKGTTTHPTNSERPFRSEKPARQSVTLISKSNSTPMQARARSHTLIHRHRHTFTHAHKHTQHLTIRQQSCLRSLLATAPTKSPSLNNKGAPTPNHLPPLHLASPLSCPSLALPCPPPPPCQTASLPSCDACPLPLRLCY